MINKYIKVWWIFTTRSTQVAFASRFGASLFLFGKLLRFFLFLFFLLVLQSQTKVIGGYSLWQIVLFFATYNLIDTISAFFFRDVYRFRSHIVSGYFDHILVKPISPLFKYLFGGSDILDIPLIILSIFLIVFAANHIDGITTGTILIYSVLLLNAFLLAMSFHIFVLGLGILATVVDNVIMAYRDITQMARFPVDIYQEPLRSIVTFVIPIGIMITFPAKALMGLLETQLIVISLLFSCGVFYLSILFWRYSLKHYASASS